jgi:hypothetical protein
LEKQLAAASCTEADLITCDIVEFIPGGIEAINRQRVPCNWPYAKAISHYKWCGFPSSALLRRRVFDKVGGFDPNLSYIEDVDLWHRISWSHRIYQMEEALCRNRQGHLNTMHPQNRQKRACWELRHYCKMLRVTPPELRDTLPGFRDFVPRRVVRVVAGGLRLRVRFKNAKAYFKDTRSSRVDPAPGRNN